jgi:hypothetical protein
MKSKIILIALALFSAQASAEWQFISEASNGAKFFMDLSTKRQQGKYTLVWSRVDYPDVEIIYGKTFNSFRVLDVYDCSEFRTGAKSIVFYFGKLGYGDVVHKQNLEMPEVKFGDVVPETIEDIKFKRVCRK